MSESHYPEFEKACKFSFSVLNKNYSFNEPIVEQIGRECFIRYLKGKHVVSIAYEFGTTPIVELFYPSSETGEEPTPWAERNGESYTRRIPKFTYPIWDNENMQSFLNACSESLIKLEKDFLLS